MGGQGSIGPKQPNIPSVGEIATSLAKALKGEDSRGRIFLTPKGFERMNWLEAGVKWLATGFKVHTVSALDIQIIGKKLKKAGATKVDMERIGKLSGELASRKSAKNTRRAGNMFFKVKDSITEDRVTTSHLMKAHENAEALKNTKTLAEKAEEWEKEYPPAENDEKPPGGKFSEETEVKVTKGNESTSFKTKTNFSERTDVGAQIKKKGYSERAEGEPSVREAIKAHYKKEGKAAPETSTMGQNVTMKALTDKPDVDYQKFTFAARNKISELAQEQKIFGSKIKHGAGLISNTLDDLLQRAEELGIRNQETLKEKLIDTIRDNNEKKEEVDREIFQDLISGGKVPLDLYQAPEYQEVLKSHKEDTWEEGVEKEITFTNFEPEDLASFKEVINAFFEDVEVQQVLEKLQFGEEIALEQPEVGEVFTPGDEKDQSGIELIETGNDPFDELYGPLEKDIDQH